MAFAPEYALPALRHFYTQFRFRIWTAYGFRDAFNLGAQWYASDELGIDQGPTVIMIENYRAQRVWRLFMQNEEVQRGLQRAGFGPLPSIAATLQTVSNQNAFDLSWRAQSNRTYQVEYSPDLETWFASPTGELTAVGTNANWTDAGPPATSALPFAAPKRFYRVIQFGSP